MLALRLCPHRLSGHRRRIIADHRHTLPVADEVRITAYTTGYSYWDNTPPGSARHFKRRHPHQGGRRGYIRRSDHGGPSGTSLRTAATRSTMRRARNSTSPISSAISSSRTVAGDGDTPQNGPCHTTGYEGHPMDRTFMSTAPMLPRKTSDACMDAITDLHLVIMNPGAELRAVVTGPVTDNCAQYGDTVVAQ